MNWNSSNWEEQLFEESLQKATSVWKYTGLKINYTENPTKNSLLGHLRKRWFYATNFFLLTAGVLSVFFMMSNLSIQKIIYMIPCLTFSFLGDFKSFYFLYHEDVVVDIIKTLKNLQSNYGDYSEEKDLVKEKFLKKRLPFLTEGNKMLLIVGFTGVAAFFIGPLVILVWQYWATGEIVLFLPYSIWYPFDEFSYGGWPLAYLHQFWSAWTAVFFIYGPDCFFYTVCTFVHNQFCSLNFDLVRIGPEYFKDQDSFRTHVGSLLHRHRELIRCIGMINIIYEKSTLFNVMSSSFIICLTGFNVMAIDDLIVMAPFVMFVTFGLVQIYLLCYYGDLLMHASIEISDAIYTSEWYRLNSSPMKCCLIILMRAQKPSKIVAFGYGDINLRTFSRILSSSWSYFTIIRTMYSN